jgi:hypothetical protein
MKTQKLTMRATLPAEPVSNGRNYGGEKETVSRSIVVAKVDGQLRPVVEARYYMGRSRSASTVYCTLWVMGKNHYSGTGNAGGYGYHKESAALAAAISSAGIVLTGSNYAHWGDKKPNYKQRAYIGGCGSSSAEMALMAIARAAGTKGQLLIV